MDKSLLDKIKKESGYIGILFVIALIVLKIVFFKEQFVMILTLAFVFFWVLILPGFSLAYYWHEKIDFLERLVIGFAISAGLVGILSYYLGLVGVHVKYHGVILPVVLLALAAFYALKKNKSQLPSAD